MSAAEFHRHAIAAAELKRRRLLFGPRETPAVRAMFAAFLDRPFNLVVNGVGFGRARFGEHEGLLYVDLDPAFFTGVESGSIVELAVEDIRTISLRLSPPIARLLAELESPDEKEVVAALRGLGTARRVEAIAAVAARLEHPSPAVRNAAVRALGRYEPRPEIAERLMGALIDADESVRSRACDALAFHRDERTRRSLERVAATDPALSVRWAAKLALRERRVEGYEQADLNMERPKR